MARAFGLALNAIRDDEDKAEAMGLRTTRYKIIAWCVAAFFLGIAGGWSATSTASSIRAKSPSPARPSASG